MNTAQAVFVYPMMLGMYFFASIFTFFGSIRLKETTPLVEYVLFPMACTFLLIIFTALLYGSASVHSTSKDFLKALKRSQKMNLKKNDVKWIKMQLKAIKPFGVKVGMLNYIKKASLLMVYGVWSNYSMTLLIIF
jgi:hypothetical protein